MSGYTKLFQEILSSSIWNEDDKTRIVWITMLAARGADNIVRASVGGLAHQARVSREDCEKALKVLESPDPDSRSREFDGRRIERVDGGFLILNGGKYRDAQSMDERRAYMREYMKTYRKDGDPVNSDVNFRKQNVNSCKQLLTVLTQTETETEQSRESTPKPPKGGNESVADEKRQALKAEREALERHANEIYQLYPLKVGKPAALKAIKAALGKETPERLKELTEAFARARGGDLSYVPNPSTWFNQQRYLDDPSTWKPKQAVLAPPSRTAGTMNEDYDIEALCRSQGITP